MMRVTTLQIAAGRCAARNPGATALCLSRAARGARRVGKGASNGSPRVAFRSRRRWAPTGRSRADEFSAVPRWRSSTASGDLPTPPWGNGLMADKTAKREAAGRPPRGDRVSQAAARKPRKQADARRRPEASTESPGGGGLGGKRGGGRGGMPSDHSRSEKPTSESQSLAYLLCRLCLEKKNTRSLSACSRRG